MPGAGLSDRIGVRITFVNGQPSIRVVGRDGMRTRDHTESQVGNLIDEQASAMHYNR